MNLSTVPKEEMEELQNQAMAKKLGPIYGWSEEQFYTVVAHTYRIPFREIRIEEVDAATFHQKQEFFIRASQIPLKRYPDILIVSESEPWDERKLQELIQEFELGVKRVLISTKNYDHLLGQLTYRKPAEKKAEEEKIHIFFPNSAWDNVEESRILLEVIRRADLMGASDIHLEPSEGFMRIRFRVHGNLLVQRKLTVRQGEEVMKSLRLEAHLLNSQTGSFQSSRIRTALPHGKTIDLRVEVAPSIAGEGDGVVMRLLDSKSINRSLEDLNLPSAYYPILMDAISKTSGLIIVTGPTGSGKTTTLYTVLQHLNEKTTKILTVEDPVEYRVAGLSQIQIDVDKGVSFPASIRSAMRMDPDIILVGEVRDEETAKLAVAAAETGHLVFTTLHTNNAIETLSRLARLGVDRYQLQTLMRLVVAQRLIGVLCPHCKTAREIKGYEKAVLNRLDISYAQDQVVYEKRGCGHCNGVGTVGRTAVYSFFAPNDDIREMLGTDCPILDIIKKAKEGGFKTVMENALHFWLQGTASFSEVHSLED